MAGFVGLAGAIATLVANKPADETRTLLRRIGYVAFAVIQIGLALAAMVLTKQGHTFAAFTCMLVAAGMYATEFVVSSGPPSRAEILALVFSGVALSFFALMAAAGPIVEALKLLAAKP